MNVKYISSMWCMSCIVMYPIIEKLKEKYLNITFEKFDYDNDVEKLKKYDLNSVLPIIIIEKNNIEIERIIGEKKEQEIINIIEKINNK